MIKSIVFDFDGVLVESVDIKTKAFSQLFENEPGEIVEKIINYHLENGGISRFEKFKYFYKYLLKRPFSKEKEKELGEKFSRLVVKAVAEAPWVSGAEETLDFFYGKISLHVASGTPEKELKGIITARKMTHYFDGIFGAPEKKTSILKKVISLTKTTPDEVAMIGDAMSDYHAAKEAGVHFIGRVMENNNPFPDKNLQTIPDLNHLKEIINNRG